MFMMRSVSDNLVGVVRETIQPARVSLWLRPEPLRRASVQTRPYAAGLLM